ncbi:MAG: GNAT family N-acetyltransferase [Nitrosopumilus sp.]|nr:GNAT family N-acetyltransferase [Nitrosopumilus sp.]NNL59059.1 GNAT family N-acetyltransferase [Nitrosopumilus sp.]
MIRNATALDKNNVLQFCKDTFSWEDYIDQVWDYWLTEGNLFVIANKGIVGICHSYFSENQIWIEGIRIKPDNRRQKIATSLVNHAEKIGKKRNIQFSFMLIDTTNKHSLLMANSLNYRIFESWNFYSLIPKRKKNYDISFAKSLDLNFTHYVKSWRWLPLDNNTLNSLLHENRIVRTNERDNYSFAILSDSEHFDKTLIVTLFSNSDPSTLQILSYLQNYGIEKDYQRIQILSKEDLPNFDLLEKKISFHLMKKSLFS